MNTQLPYNPNPSAVNPIPVWVPNTTGTMPTAPIRPFATIHWLPLTSKTPPPPSSHTTFHRFPLLPPELRLRIWSFSAPSDRVIEIRSWGSGRYAPVKFTVHPHRLPTIFRVCKESRMEARRIYKAVEVGVSAWVRKEGGRYVDWKFHPENIYARGLTVGTAPNLPIAEPYPPARVFISWDRDIIYLGPEFQKHHLLAFFTATGLGEELRGLQRLAIGKKLWLEDEDGTWNILRRCLWSLKAKGGVREVMIVPDDEKGALVDRWYRGKHDIVLKEPGWGYRFRPMDGEFAKTVDENLREWFERLWRDKDEGSLDDDSDDSAKGKETERPREVRPEKEPPKVSVKSIRRGGRRMNTDFRDGIWQIQEAMGDMRMWESWNPPETS